MKSPKLRAVLDQLAVLTAAVARAESRLHAAKVRAKKAKAGLKHAKKVVRQERKNFKTAQKKAKHLKAAPQQAKEEHLKAGEKRAPKRWTPKVLAVKSVRWSKYVGSAPLPMDNARSLMDTPAA